MGKIWTAGTWSLKTSKKYNPKSPSSTHIIIKLQKEFWNHQEQSDSSHKKELTEGCKWFSAISQQKPCKQGESGIKVLQQKTKASQPRMLYMTKLLFQVVGEIDTIRHTKAEVVHHQ